MAACAMQMWPPLQVRFSHVSPHAPGSDMACWRLGLLCLTICALKATPGLRRALAHAGIHECMWLAVNLLMARLPRCDASSACGQCLQVTG